MTSELPNISEEQFQLYRNYANFRDVGDLQRHLIAIQEQLLKEGEINYKCIERYKFACTRLYERFFYKNIVSLGKELLEKGEAPYFLDVGCCTGTDLRKLLIDGYPSNFLMGMDIQQSYIECGYKLFRDSPKTCPIQFIVNDLFSIDESYSLCHTISIVHAGSVFHLFQDYETIARFLEKIVLLLKPNGVLAGGHVCTEESVEYYRESKQLYKYYMGINDFRELLQSKGFVDIQLETQPRLDEEDHFTAFWISFYAVFQPKSDIS
ncbi:S-adenosyl-L-methionine-dependent methyltransferase [Choanephora cucurbitarum]|nr:S-adenosyl-L-methionine-dependent methyltransferase [Choanephora cucurbitarum]